MNSCGTCTVELVIGENWTQGAAKFGRKLCQKCKSIYDKSYNEKNRERDRKHRRTYREANRSMLIAREKAWHKANKDKVKAYRKNRRDTRNAILNRYKRMKGCAVCGENCVECLDYHAPNGHQDYRPTTMALGAWNRIKAEVFRCVVVCANCHRKLHAGLIKLPKETE